jgi:hypothetical protein
LRAASCAAAFRKRVGTARRIRPTTVENAIPKMPQWKTNVKIVLSTTLMTFDQIPAHIVAFVSPWAFTIESGGPTRTASAPIRRRSTDP